MGRGAGFTSFPPQQILKFIGGPAFQTFLQNPELIVELAGGDSDGVHVLNGGNDLALIIAILPRPGFVMDVTKIEADSCKGLLVNLKAM